MTNPVPPQRSSDLSVELEYICRQLRGELSRSIFAGVLVRHADGRSQGRTRQAESVYRRARVSVEGPASHVFIRGRTVPEDALLETHRMRDGSWRRRSMEPAHRQAPLAQRLEYDTIREPRLRFVPAIGSASGREKEYP